MAKLPQVSGKDMGRVLTRLGLYLRSQKGSHMKFVREREARREIIIIPNHAVLRKGTLDGILKKLTMDIAELKKFL